MEDGSPSAGSKRKAEELEHNEFQTPELKDAWISCPRLGQPIARAPFLPCKPPLKGTATELLEEGDRFDGGMFMQRQIEASRDVGMVISLLDPQRGFPIPQAQEWDDWDVEYLQIAPKSAQQVAADVQKAVSAFVKQRPNSMVAIFCEDGCNLTGYAICAYLHQVFGMPIKDALAEFAKSRPPGIFHQPFIQDLWDRFAKREDGDCPQVKEKPSWASNAIVFVAAHGDFALPIIKPIAPESKSAEDLPAGWSKHWSKTHNKPYYFNRSTGKQSWEVPTNGDVKQQPSKMGVAHILIKHKNSRRTSSWKDKEGNLIKQRSLEDAKLILQGIRELLAQQSAGNLRKKFHEIAKKESDCSSAAKHGDLGMVSKGSLHPAFEAAYSTLQVGQLSDIVETDSGVHIILRTA